jgi:hypothetical protein
MESGGDFRVPPLPAMPIPFDFWKHEYWRLGERYRELAEWEQALIARQQQLDRQGRWCHRGGRGGGGGRRRYQRYSSQDVNHHPDPEPVLPKLEQDVDE